MTPRKLSRRESIKCGAGFMVGSLLGASMAAGQPAVNTGRKRNVLFINVDQLRSDALSCEGNPHVQTPNIDRLARQGVRFTNGHSAAPVCGPARTCWHTGMSAFKHGVLSNRLVYADFPFNSGHGTFEKNLGERGYHSEFHGRWHSPSELLSGAYQNEVDTNYSGPYRAYLNSQFGPPPAPGVDQAKDGNSGWPVDLDFPEAFTIPNDRKWALESLSSLTLPEGYDYDTICVDAAVESLERLQHTPFAMTVSLMLPHPASKISKKYRGKVNPNEIPFPDSFRSDRSNTPWENTWWELNEAEREYFREWAAAYYEKVQMVDDRVGRLLDALDLYGLSENTLVIFTSDHGEMLGEHGLQQKLFPYRGSAAVPFILRLPGVIPAGGVYSHPVGTLDIFPTVFDYLGEDCPPVDGYSVRPIIEGRKGHNPEFTIAELGDTMSPYTAFIYRDWKYVWSHDDDQVDVLYDLKNDPQESVNLLGSHPERDRYIATAERIRNDMVEWMKRIDHPSIDRLRASTVK